nr:transporter substrate-binding domain-containing protein [Burkholderia pyrrocinia]
MKRGLTKFLLLIAVALAAAQVHAKAWKDIRIGYEGAYPPFSSMQPDGTPMGFDIDIIHRCARRCTPTARWCRSAGTA